MLNDVGLAVMSDTKNAQAPRIFASSIPGRIYLNPSNVPPPPKPSEPRFEGNAPSPPMRPADRPEPNGKSLAFIQEATKQLENQAYPEARATLSQGINADPRFALPYSYRGYAWYKEGLRRDPTEAILAYRQGFHDLDKAIDLDPTYAPARRHRGNTILATYKALRAQGKPTNNIIDDAIADLRAAVALDSMSKTNANALGNAYLLKGSYRQAIESFKNAIARDDSYAEPYAGLCAAYHALGELDTARKNAQLATNRDSDHRSQPCLNKTISDFIRLG